MNFSKSLAAIYQKIRITLQLHTLDILAAGVEEEMPYVELKNGLRFYGLSPRPKDRKYYKLLSGSMKRKVPFKNYQVAMDILIRYVEGGLKIGGPRKEDQYKVKSGDTIAEMGAYMGYYTLYLAGKVGKDGKVIAIEPMPDNLNFLKKNVSYNKLDNVIVVEKGVWNKKETQSFFQTEKDSQSASMVLKNNDKKEVSIEVDTLDSILKESNTSSVDLMLVQLNGVEAEALEGLTQVMPANFSIAARYKSDDLDPVISIEKLLRERAYAVTIRNGGYIYACHQ